MRMTRIGMYLRLRIAIPPGASSVTRAPECAAKWSSVRFEVAPYHLAARQHRVAQGGPERKGAREGARQPAPRAPRLGRDARRGEALGLARLGEQVDRVAGQVAALEQDRAGALGQEGERGLLGVVQLGNN